jgi:hypothetical protein
MSVPNTTYRVLVEKLGDSDPEEFIGNQGELFYDPNAPILKLSDGSTAGGASIGGTGTGGAGGSYWVPTNAGIHTLSNVGIGTTNPTEELTVFGDARVTGILTVGTASITLDGTTNIINVGSGVTIDGSTGIINVGSGVTIDGSTGIIEASSILIGTTTITGAAVTSITAGSGISVDQSTGNVTITATGGGGAGGSYWVPTNAGIHTLSNVGIGTTNASEQLTVQGNLIIDNASLYGSAIAIGSTTSEVAIHSELSASAYRSVEYTIQATSYTYGLQLSKMLCLVSELDDLVQFVTFGTIYNKTGVATFSADVSGGNIRVLALANSSEDVNYQLNFVANKKYGTNVFYTFD